MATTLEDQANPLVPLVRLPPGHFGFLMGIRYVVQPFGSGHFVFPQAPEGAAAQRENPARYLFARGRCDVLVTRLRGRRNPIDHASPVSSDSGAAGAQRIDACMQ